MGSLVSVLNWTCDNCRSINEIESFQCSYCQSPRKIKDDNVDETGETEQLFASYSSDSEEENDKFETVKRIQCKKVDDTTKELPELFEIDPIIG